MSPRRIAGALALVALISCKDEPLVPGVMTAESVPAFSSTAGQPVPTASLPAVRVTSTGGKPVPDVEVTFQVTSGGGSIPSGGSTAMTDADGIATVGAWTLGTTAGANLMTASIVSDAVGDVVFTATGTAGPPTKLGVTTAPSATVANRAAFGTQPVVQLQDVHSNAVSTSGTTVTATISAGGGTLAGTATATTSSSGAATFTNLSIQGTAGQRTLTFAAQGLVSATATVTTTAGTATTIAKDAGDAQSALPSTAVATPPSVKVSDVDGNGVAGTSVTFAVTGGGGSVTGTPATSGANGIATVGSWTMGSALGANTMTATATGLNGSPLTFTATSTNSLVSVTAVTPATITSGSSVTITGSGFSATPANNTVTIDGVAATVSTANATTLTLTAPNLPCTAAHSGAVSVTVSGSTGTRNHPVQAATQHTLAVGGSVILSTATTARCNELHNANATAQYYVTVYNSNTTYGTGTPAAFELKGTSGAASGSGGASVVSTPIGSFSQRALGPSRGPLTPEQLQDRAHLDHLERSLAFHRANGSKWRNGQTLRLDRASSTPAYAVGDAVNLKIGDLNSANYCSTSLAVTGRVAYVGTRSIIIEDQANDIKNIDTTYAQIGNEFDTVMWPILETNYGNPIVNDDVLDNNDKIIMVFSKKVSTFSGGNLAGFVSPCDMYQTTTWPSSNVGEYFYATAPTASGDITVTGSPPRWRWTMRGTIIHEVKHIVSVGERFSRNGGSVFEESWLEETTARLSEELFERARYSGFAQRGNMGYGSAADQRGPYCGVRSACGQARGIVRVFEEMAASTATTTQGWYTQPHNFSPIGRIDASDFSFYATGWSLIRWAIDANTNKTEAAILKGMTQAATQTGVTNFDAQMGTTVADAIPKWIMAMILDDHPTVTPADATLKQPSWNLRSIYAGYDTDFAVVPWNAWPFNPTAQAFGAFSRTGSARPGTGAIIYLSGTQALKQILELKADGSTAAAPTELRMAIVRIQ